MSGRFLNWLDGEEHRPVDRGNFTVTDKVFSEIPDSLLMQIDRTRGGCRIMELH